MPLRLPSRRIWIAAIVLAAVFAGALLTLRASYTAPASLSADVSLQFSDLPAGTLEATAVLALARQNILHGYPDGTFRGNNFVNRAETAKILLLAFGHPLEDLQNNGQYPDVQRGTWYEPYILNAAKLGIMTGGPDGTFRPEATINTAEFLKMLTIASGSQQNLITQGFHDVRSSDWFAPYAGLAWQRHLFPHRPASYLLPANPVTRYEVAVAIYLLTYPQTTATASASPSASPTDSGNAPSAPVASNEAPSRFFAPNPQQDSAPDTAVGLNASPQSVPPGESAVPCALADCGPALGMPNMLCQDGTVAGPTGQCVRTGQGQCQWDVRRCPQAATANNGHPDLCGNRVCDRNIGENVETCPSDCQNICGDNVCNPNIGENADSCPADCKGPCGANGCFACRAGNSCATLNQTEECMINGAQRADPNDHDTEVCCQNGSVLNWESGKSCPDPGPLPILKAQDLPAYVQVCAKKAYDGLPLKIYDFPPLSHVLVTSARIGSETQLLWRTVLTFYSMPVDEAAHPRDKYGNIVGQDVFNTPESYHAIASCIIIDNPGAGSCQSAVCESGIARASPLLLKSIPLGSDLTGNKLPQYFARAQECAKGHYSFPNAPYIFTKYDIIPFSDVFHPARDVFTLHFFKTPFTESQLFLGADSEGDPYYLMKKANEGDEAGECHVYYDPLSDQCGPVACSDHPGFNYFGDYREDLQPPPPGPPPANVVAPFCLRACAPAACGNNNCEVLQGENAVTCPQDCGAFCGDGVCNYGETAQVCPVDCSQQGIAR